MLRSDPILHSGIGVACGENTQFKRLYDFYFPKHNGGLASFYRQGFDETLFKLPSGPQDERRHRELYFAFHGNPKAFHKFVHNVDREGAGEFALTWTYECVLLLLKLGDDQFAALLATEDKQTREIVGQTIDSQINWSKHHFPKTRALYSYRTTSSARWRQ